MNLKERRELKLLMIYPKADIFANCNAYQYHKRIGGEVYNPKNGDRTNEEVLPKTDSSKQLDANIEMWMFSVGKKINERQP